MSTNRVEVLKINQRISAQQKLKLQHPIVNIMWYEDLYLQMPS